MPVFYHINFVYFNLLHRVPSFYPNDFEKGAPAFLPRATIYKYNRAIFDSYLWQFNFVFRIKT